MDIQSATAAVDQIAPSHVHPHAHRHANHIDMPNVVLTSKQAAQVLSVSVRTLERLIKNGVLRVYRVGLNGPRRFRREDLERALIPDHTPDQAIDGLGNFISQHASKKQG